MVHSDAQEASGGRAKALAEANALAKVEAARIPAEAQPGAFVLGTDTVVSLGRHIMGKPESAAEAARMLTALAGRTHRVVSGVALARLGAGCTVLGEALVSSACTRVSFARLDETQIDGYVRSGEWKGKAGGYAVQGIAALFVVGLRGEYSNVVGLPLQLLYRLFRESGFDLLRREWTAEARGT